MVPSTLYAYASSTVAFQQSRSGCNAKSTKTGRNPHGTARSRRQWNRIPNKKTSCLPNHQANFNDLSTHAKNSADGWRTLKPSRGWLARWRETRTGRRSHKLRNLRSSAIENGIHQPPPSSPSPGLSTRCPRRRDSSSGTLPEQPRSAPTPRRPASLSTGSPSASVDVLAWRV